MDSQSVSSSCCLSSVPVELVEPSEEGEDSTGPRQTLPGTSMYAGSLARILNQGGAAGSYRTSSTACLPVPGRCPITEEPTCEASTMGPQALCQGPNLYPGDEDWKTLSQFL